MRLKPFRLVTPGLDKDLIIVSKGQQRQVSRVVLRPMTKTTSSQSKKTAIQDRDYSISRHRDGLIVRDVLAFFGENDFLYLAIRGL